MIAYRKDFSFNMKALNSDSEPENLQRATDLRHEPASGSKNEARV